MSKYKQLIAGLLIGCTVTTVGAAYATPTIQASIADSVKFILNGKSESLPPSQHVLNYNGYNYVPVRFVADRLGAKVAWDQATQTVSIISQPDAESSPYFNAVVFPDGTRFSDTGTMSATYNGIEYNLHFYLNNHTAIISKEPVQTQYGPAELMLVRMSAPAAAMSSETQDYYDLVVNRSLYSEYSQSQITVPFILEAKITSNPQEVKTALLEVAKSWYISDKSTPAAPTP